MSAILTYKDNTISFEDLSEARCKAYDVLTTEKVNGVTITRDNGRVDIYFRNPYDINVLSELINN